MKEFEIIETTPSVNHSNYYQCLSSGNWVRSIFDYELIYIISGEFSYSDEDNSIILQKNDILIIEPGVYHKLKVISKVEQSGFSCIHFEFQKGLSSLKNQYRVIDKFPLVVNADYDPEIIRLFKKCNYLYEGNDSFREEIINLTLKEILLRMKTCITTNSNPNKPNKLKEIIIYISENIEEKLSRQILAKKFSISPGYLSYLFRENLDITVSDYINQIKIKAAFELLTQRGLRVNEVADKLGYCDQFYFSKIFKKIMGYSPSKHKA
jgi:AraC-like DNA-binding protein